MEKKLKSKIDSFGKALEKEIYLPNKIQHLAIAILLGLLSFLVIWLYQPWDTSEYRADGKMLLLLGYGAITASCYYLAYAIPLLVFKRNYAAKKWNAYNESAAFVLFVMVLSASTQVYHHTYFNANNYSILSFIHWTIGVLELGFFLFLLLIIWKLQQGKKQIQEAISNCIGEIDKTVIIEGANKNEKFKFNPDKIIYLKSDKNYIEIFYKNDHEEIDKKLLRGTLLSMEKQLGAQQFIRIHNSYIVNRNFISKLYIENTAYFIRLMLNDKIELPVSRKYRDYIREILDE